MVRFNPHFRQASSRFRRKGFRIPAGIPPVSLFPFTLVNEAGSGVIAAADLPELRVSINGGAYQTIAAAGLTLAVNGSDLVVSGFADPNSTRSYTWENGGSEAYNAPDTVVGANTTGTSIKGLYARHATGPKPAVPLLAGIPVAPTLSGSPVVAA